MLCKVARLTVVPPMGTGFSAATGVSFPVRPTCDQNVFDLGDAGTGSVFVGDGPARSFAGVAKFVLQRSAIDFDHDAVDFIGQLFAAGFLLLDEFPDFVEVFGQFAAGVHFEAGGVEGVESLPVAVEIGAAVFQQHVGKIIEAAFGGDAGIELADGSGSGVARVGE